MRVALLMQLTLQIYATRVQTIQTTRSRGQIPCCYVMQNSGLKEKATNEGVRIRLLDSVSLDIHSTEYLTGNDVRDWALSDRTGAGADDRLTGRCLK